MNSGKINGVNYFSRLYMNVIILFLVFVHLHVESPSVQYDQCCLSNMHTQDLVENSHNFQS